MSCSRGIPEALKDPSIYGNLDCLYEGCLFFASALLVSYFLYASLFTVQSLVAFGTFMLSRGIAIISIHKKYRHIKRTVRFKFR